MRLFLGPVLETHDDSLVLFYGSVLFVSVPALLATRLRTSRLQANQGHFPFFGNIRSGVLPIFRQNLFLL
jgi:hypothetical protein